MNSLKITQIAAMTGLSMSTVSRVLAGKANTSKKARETVLDCARSLGIMTTLQSGRFLVNNVVIFAPIRAFNPHLDIFYYHIIQGIRQALSGYDVRIHPMGLDENQNDIPGFLHNLMSQTCEACVLIGIDDAKIHERLIEMKIPCVLINCYDKKMKLDSISPDHYQIGYNAASTLIEFGHQRIIALLSLRRYTMEQRLQGIKDAFSDHHLLFDEYQQLITTSGFSAEEAENILTHYLTQNPTAHYPTAILSGGDFISFGIANALHRQHLHIPQDISLMSMDGFNLADIQHTPLTTFHVPRTQLGIEAISLLKNRILAPDAPSHKVLLGGELVLRETVQKNKKHITSMMSENAKLYDEHPPLSS